MLTYYKSKYERLDKKFGSLHPKTIAAWSAWIRAENEDDKREKEAKLNTVGCCTSTAYTVNDTYKTILSFGDCKPCAPTCPPINISAPCKEEKTKGTTMYLNGSSDLEAQKRNYFAEQAGRVYSGKYQALRKDFGLEDDDAPTSPKEFDERIKAGRYTWSTKDLDKKTSYYNLTESWIIWRDPSVKKDQDGFEAAEAKLSTARTKATTQFVVGDLTSLPKVLEDFESATFH